jgi:hypothetical protein
MMQHLLLMVSSAVWCLIGLLLVVGIHTIAKLRPPRAAAQLGAVPSQIARSAPLEKIRGHSVHSEPLVQKLLVKLMEDRKRREDLIAQIDRHHKELKRLAQPKRTRVVLREHTHSVSKRYNLPHLVGAHQLITAEHG